MTNYFVSSLNFVHTHEREIYSLAEEMKLVDREATVVRIILRDTAVSIVEAEYYLAYVEDKLDIAKMPSLRELFDRIREYISTFKYGNYMLSGDYISRLRKIDLYCDEDNKMSLKEIEDIRRAVKKLDMVDKAAAEMQRQAQLSLLMEDFANKLDTRLKNVTFVSLANETAQSMR